MAGINNPMVNNDLEADSAPIAWQKHRDKLVRLRGLGVVGPAGAMGITSIRLPPASTDGHVRAGLSCKAKHGWAGLKLGQITFCKTGTWMKDDEMYI